MNSLYKFCILLGIATLLFASCDDEYGPRKESTPVIQSAGITPASFTFGDSITLTASLIDPATTLSMLDYEIVSENRVITSGSIPVNGETVEVSHPIFVPLLSNQADNANVKVNLVVTNILKGSVSSEITDLTGKRPVYNQLYLVADDGNVAVLKAQSADKYVGSDLTFDSSFNFKIAEKINADNTIDYSGAVYGNVNGKIAMIDEKGESAFAYTPNVDYTKSFTYDNFAFSVTAAGSALGADDIALSAFGEQDVYNESFRTLTRKLENGKTYTLVGKLADKVNVYNPDFFERTSNSKVKFLGETGEYTIYYNPVRKNIIVGVDNPSYPQYLLACGYGLGYPTNVTSAEIAAVYSGHQRTHTDWGFGHVMNYVLLRRVSEGVYQGTFYTPGDNDHYAGFKPFENTGWGNEKKAGSFTFTGEKIITGDNDWTIPNGDNDPRIESTNYRFTVNLNNNTVHVEKVTL
ncbi:hypothetical protein M2459_002153 [Parabacteroides sp. PF5-5]|uniref:hypothetical protein n=1 Tax=unclassified Parabacteroides TaxID=2649774 RepID=UPI002472F3D8|nr:MULTISPECIES: hypothetical protein [unclassified Parabacteroides]MDH6306831.1 hypothetical protein [Parabacteroides sp. PH5-39]MDH6316276.1 hypothetical protein [Parabacteroides sp. PF5-13]MDH6319759.1 hypothetical protein [Parabacteroides sp. PH5-13]MDH6323649.1 hypothetical protein [Parabacteroides sp. PH5-8]MDH6327463.1 hypothetical protein [Parabacteroides sp. PH5-41]